MNDNKKEEPMIFEEMLTELDVRLKRAAATAQVLRAELQGLASAGASPERRIEIALAPFAAPPKALAARAPSKRGQGKTVAAGDGARLRELRKRAGLTMKQLAHRAKASPVTVWKAETGAVGAETLARLMAAVSGAKAKSAARKGAGARLDLRPFPAPLPTARSRHVEAEPNEEEDNDVE